MNATTLKTNDNGNGRACSMNGEKRKEHSLLVEKPEGE
jgi:hypothetical protein